MHIFEGARHLSNGEWVIRAIIAYIFLILVAKAMGQRSIAQLRFLDVVLVLLLGGIFLTHYQMKRLDYSVR